MQPACVYDIKASWADNIQQGPQWAGPVPVRQLPPATQLFDFLGHKVASRLGVPAGPLLDSSWTTFAARMGFDILTYKTIRTQPSTGHAPPNVLYLQADQQLTAADAATPLTSVGQQLPPPDAATSSSQQQATSTAGPPAAPAAPPPTAAVAAAAAAAPLYLQQSVAITNSFGMPSMGREFLLDDIPKAAAALGPGQVLVVSVTGSPNQADGMSFTDDFVQAALLAQQAGAELIEANLSCPNVGKGQGALYTDAQQVSLLASALVSALGPSTPLIIKVGAFDSRQQLEAVLIAAAAAGVRAVAGINGLSRTVLNPDGSPALGPDRPTSGVCGAPIRAAALEFVAAARDVIDSRRLGLTLIGVGGVSSGQHVVDMLAAGADFVQSATGMMWNPLLAHEYHTLAYHHHHHHHQQQQQEECGSAAGGSTLSDQLQQRQPQQGCVQAAAKQASVATDGAPSPRVLRPAIA